MLALVWCTELTEALVALPLSLALGVLPLSLALAVLPLSLVRGFLRGPRFWPLSDRSLRARFSTAMPLPFVVVTVLTPVARALRFDP